MNRHRIIEILEAYRPGEGLESDPEVQQALQEAEKDPELAELRDQMRAFDDAFSAALDRIEVPDGLQERILLAAGNRKVEASVAADSPSSSIFNWFHPATFAAAAAIIILLALSFTFTSRPVPDVQPLALSQDPVSATAHKIYQNLNPAFRSRDGSEVLEYLRSQQGLQAASLPGDIAWDEAFACDVIEVDGRKVSIVCFRAPDNSRSMHLFTFLRSDFPNVEIPTSPQIRQDGHSCCATWGNDEQIHVLYSDKGEENLRRILDI